MKTNAYHPDASIKLVAINNDNNIVLGRMEHALLSEGFQVVVDNELRGSVPYEQLNVATSDTSYLLSRRQTIGIKMFPEKQADYILRTNYTLAPSFSRLKFSEFSAAMIDPETGQTVASVQFFQNPVGIGRRKANKVIDDFVKDLKQ
ncbi:MAG: hypothetical protein IPL65_00260 [Lewinellaceae bacterium]|nr:hypothetical protein [Lewinellaceae bacterium]